MRIIIENQKPYDDKFVKWLIRKIKAKLFSEVNISLLKSLNEKFDAAGVQLNLEVSFIHIVNNIKYSKNKFYYHIFIDDNKIIPGTKYRCTTVAKLINYGTLDILGYEVFSKIFNEVSNNIDKYLEEHSLAVGVI